MSDPFLGEIRIFASNFAITGWAFCNGQLLPISQHTALFSLLGTTYGGDGQSTFALPNLQGRTAIGAGQGPGLSNRDLGENGGTTSETLTLQQLGSHTHAANAGTAGATGTPGANIWGQGARGRPPIYGPAANLTTMNASAMSLAGGSQPHNNMQPYLTLNYLISLQGIFPS
jgi:microcystin-dependent protein